MPSIVRNVLTAAKVEKAKPAKQLYRLHDGAGLYLTIATSAARYWEQRVTIGGKRSWRGLGPFPVVGLREARDASFQLQRAALLPAVVAPVAVAFATPASAITFGAAADAALAAVSGNWKEAIRAKSEGQWRARLESYVFPKLANGKDTPAAELTGADVLAILTPIWRTKAETASKVRIMVSRIFDWLVGAGHRSSNPVALAVKALGSNDKAKGNFEAMPFDELPGFVRELREYDNDAMVKLALEFVVITAKRSGEVRGARWEEFDTKAALWAIPGERTKTGEPHNEPLSARALEILREARRIRSGAFVFRAVLDDKPMSDMTLSQVMRRNGQTAQVHGFRSTFRDWAAVQRVDGHPQYSDNACELALSHSIGGKVKKAYLRDDLIDERRELMAGWAAYCTGSAPVKLALVA